MKAKLKKTIHDEGGAALAVTLVLLVIGGLMMAPLLGHMGTGTLAGELHEKKTDQLYLADAGIEYAIWHLRTGGAYNETLKLHEIEETRVVFEEARVVSVDVDISKIGTACDEMGLYEIVSTATSKDGSSTTVRCYVNNITITFQGNTTGSNEEIRGNILVESGGLTVDAGTSITGNAKIYGDTSFSAGSSVGGKICVLDGGDLTLNAGTHVFNNVAYVEGDLIMNNEAIVEGDGEFHVRGNVLLKGSATIKCNLYTIGDVTLEGAASRIITEEVWAGGNVAISGPPGTISIIGNVHVSSDSTVGPIAKIDGDITYDFYDERVLDYCPFDFGAVEMLFYEIT